MHPLNGFFIKNVLSNRFLLFLFNFYYYFLSQVSICLLSCTILNSIFSFRESCVISKPIFRLRLICSEGVDILLTMFRNEKNEVICNSKFENSLYTATITFSGFVCFSSNLKNSDHTEKLVPSLTGYSSC